MLIQGCAHLSTAPPDEQGYIWRLERVPITKDRWYYFELTELMPICRESYACSVVKQPNIFCLIYLPKNAPKWVKEHEEKHCMGYNHHQRSLEEIKQYLPKKNKNENSDVRYREHNS